MLESACKQVLNGRSVPYTSSTTLPALYALTVKEVELDQLRNALGDSHGRGPGSARPSQRHSHLAVSLAAAMSAFLLATDEGRKRP
jgi:hypothetical protein